MDEITKNLWGMLNAGNTLAVIGVLAIIAAWRVWIFASKTVYPELMPHVTAFIQAGKDFFRKITDLGEKHEETLKLNTALTQQIHTRVFLEATEQKMKLDAIHNDISAVKKKLLGD